jgi:hypothetical protein
LALLAGIFAIREAMDFDTGKAIVTVLISWVISFAITFAISAVMGGGLAVGAGLAG